MPKPNRTFTSVVICKGFGKQHITLLWVILEYWLNFRPILSFNYEDVLQIWWVNRAISFYVWVSCWECDPLLKQWHQRRVGFTCDHSSLIFVKVYLGCALAHTVNRNSLTWESTCLLRHSHILWLSREEACLWFMWIKTFKFSCTECLHFWWFQFDFCWVWTYFS